MANIYLIEGPVGAGKSTFGLQLVNEVQGIRICLDEWMRDLFRPERPQSDVLDWYENRKSRCVNQILSVACDISHRGIDVILELGLIRQQERLSVYDRVQAEGHKIIVFVVEAPRSLRLSRVRNRNENQGKTHHAYISDEFFALADTLWQAPDVEEQDLIEIRFINSTMS